MKPKDEELKKYTNAIQSLLKDQKWSIEIKLSEAPLITRSLRLYCEGPEEWWFSRIIVTDESGKTFEFGSVEAGVVTVHSSLDDVFIAALNIQNAVYRAKGGLKDVQNDLEDRYWLLWENYQDMKQDVTE